jgi:phosphate starvation-inducible PhoH-like protein
MRGRTLARSFVILDEAQNTTPGQMKMLLTRLGEHSRCVVTGDLTQVDLAGSGAQSGLLHAARILDGIKGIGMMTLTGEDIVRHRLVRDIVAAYDRDAPAGEEESA